MSASPKCGQFEYPNATLPVAANRSISDNTLNKVISTSDVKAAFGGSATVVYFEDASFDDAAAIEFADCIGRSSTLSSIVLRGCKMSGPSWSAVLAGLVENSTVTEVHLENCGLGGEQIKEIAQTVVPWNRNVSTWNFAGNTAIGLAGAAALVTALMDATSGIQRLSLKRCGIADGGASFASLLQAAVRSLYALYQLDLLENDVLGKPDFAATEVIPFVDGALKDNYIANGYDNPDAHNTPLLPLVTLAIENMRKKAAAEAAAGGAPLGTAKPSRGGTPVRRGAAPAAPAATSQVKRAQHSPVRTAPSTPSARGKSPAPQPTTPTRQRPSASSAARARSPVTRSSSTNQNASPARSAISTAPPVQQDVDAGYEEWRKVREEYNKFIRAEGPTKPNPIHITKYKYAFGKSVDKVKERPSPTFVPSHAGRTREATAAERARLAPWKQPGSVSGKKYVFPDENDPQGAQIVVVDGGDITALSDDPRDMGYMARKMERGELQRNTKTGGFASTTPRVCRWGVDGTSGVLRHAQAPGPGTYQVKMDWEVKLEKLRASSRKETATQKNLFGSSGEERKVFHVKKTDTPGPGEYEIP